VLCTEFLLLDWTSDPRGLVNIGEPLTSVAEGFTSHVPYCGAYQPDGPPKISYQTDVTEKEGSAGELRFGLGDLPLPPTEDPWHSKLDGWDDATDNPKTGILIMHVGPENCFSLSISLLSGNGFAAPCTLPETPACHVTLTLERTDLHRENLSILLVIL